MLRTKVNQKLTKQIPMRPFFFVTFDVHSVPLRICVELLWAMPFEEIRMGAENYNSDMATAGKDTNKSLLDLISSNG